MPDSSVISEPGGLPAGVGASARPRPPAAVALPASVAVALVFAVFPLGAGAFIAAFLAAALVVLSAIDLQLGVIPNRVVLPATAVVLVARLAFFPDRAAEWVLAMLVAGLAFLLPRLVNASWMGMGDVKLAMLIGAALGWGIAFALPLGFVCAWPVAVLMLARGGLRARQKTIPFGPFLALGALIVLFFPYLAGLPTG